MDRQLPCCRNGAVSQSRQPILAVMMLILFVPYIHDWREEG